MKEPSLPLLSVALLLLALATTPALAKKPDHAGKHDKIEKSDESGSRLAEDAIALVLRFTDTNRSEIRTYLRAHHAPHCPPGLAKKNNGCLPPGQAKKYRVGGVLGGPFDAVPHDLIARLGPPPQGAFYAMVDKDVLLVSEATKKVLDAVTLLSAME